MTFIKEKWNNGIGTQRCVIRTHTYADSAAHIQKLATEAQKDFPGLKAEDIDVVHYGGDFCKHTYGVEFNRQGEIPSEYRESSAIPKL
jgi:hypothetical protein